MKSPSQIILTVSLMRLPHDCQRFDEGNGGSQGSLLMFERTANELGLTVFSEQRHWLKNTQKCSQTWYQGKNFKELSPSLVVLMRRCDAQFASRYRRLYPSSKIVCWIKDDNTVTNGLLGSSPPLDHAFIVSKSAAKKSMRLFGTPSERLHVIYNPFRENTEWYDDLRKKSRINTFDMIASGKPDHKTLRGIMKRLIRRDSRFKLHICAAKWRRDANNGDVPNTIYHGNIPHTKVIQLISTSFVQINPTKSIETFGYSFAESNVLGVPVITNHVHDSTPEEMLRHWNRNIVLPSLDVWPFVESILKLHSHRRNFSDNVTQHWPLKDQMNASQFVASFIRKALL